METAHLEFQNDAKSILNRATEVIRIEIDALQKLAESLDETFVAACRTILDAKGRVIVTGLGNSGQIRRQVAATFPATGAPGTHVPPG